MNLNLIRNSGSDYTVPRKEIYREVEEVEKVLRKELWSPEQERIAKIVLDAAFEMRRIVLNKKNLFDLFDLAVKKFRRLYLNQ
jgi:hypothetical protein